MSENIGFVLRKDQRETTDLIKQIYSRDKHNRFAGAISPTGGGKSFISIETILSAKGNDYSNKKNNSQINVAKMLYAAPSHEILSQVKLHIVKHVIFGISNLESMSIIDIEEMLAADFPQLGRINLNGVTDFSSASEKKNAIIRELSTEQITQLVSNAFPNLQFRCYQGMDKAIDEGDNEETSEDVAEETLDEGKAKGLDLIIIDEAHHTVGTEVWSKNMANLIKNNPKSKALAVTATPVRQDEREQNAMDELARIVYGEEYVASDEYMAKELYVLDAMRDGIITAPEVVHFNVALANSKEYAEIRAAWEKADGTDKEKLGKVLDEMEAIIGFSPRYMSKSEIAAKRKEAIQNGIAENIANVNGKYIAFIPSNVGNGLNTEQYFKRKIEEIREYFAHVVDENGNPVNIEFSYITSDVQTHAREENAQAIKDFEDASSTSGGIKILVAVNMLNEGVHVDGIDGSFMFRDIESKNSTLYLQQSGRCISSMTPGKSLEKQDRRQIFDIVGNTFGQVNNECGNKVSHRYYLGRIKEIRDWMQENGFPDINRQITENMSSEEKAIAEQEIRMAITLKKLQGKYIYFRSGDLPREDREKISEILSISSDISLWDVDIPQREGKPTEEELSGEKFLSLNSDERRFEELYYGAKSLAITKAQPITDRTAKLINILKVINNHNPEIKLPDGIQVGKEKTKSCKSVDLLEFLQANFDEQEVDIMLREMQDYDALNAKNRREIYHIGESYDLGLELATVRGLYCSADMENKVYRRIYERYPADQIISLGIFAPCRKNSNMQLLNDLHELFGVQLRDFEQPSLFLKNPDTPIKKSNGSGPQFILPPELAVRSFYTGEKYYDERDCFGYDEEGYDKYGYDALGFNRDKIHRDTQTRSNPRGFYWDVESKKWLNRTTGTEYDILGYDVYGIDAKGFEQPKGPVKVPGKDDEYVYVLPKWYVRTQEGIYERRGTSLKYPEFESQGENLEDDDKEEKKKEEVKVKPKDVHDFMYFNGSKWGSYGDKSTIKVGGFYSNGTTTGNSGPYAREDFYGIYDDLDIDGYNIDGFKAIPVDGKIRYIHRDTARPYDLEGRVYDPKKQGPRLHTSLHLMDGVLDGMLLGNKSFDQVVDEYARKAKVSKEEAKENIMKHMKIGINILSTLSNGIERYQQQFLEAASSLDGTHQIDAVFAICPQFKNAYIRKVDECLHRLGVEERIVETEEPAKKTQKGRIEMLTQRKNEYNQILRRDER